MVSTLYKRRLGCTIVMVRACRSKIVDSSFPIRTRRSLSRTILKASGRALSRGGAYIATGISNTGGSTEGTRDCRGTALSNPPLLTDWSYVTPANSGNVMVKARLNIALRRRAGGIEYEAVSMTDLSSAIRIVPDQIALSRINTPSGSDKAGNSGGGSYARK